MISNILVFPNFIAEIGLAADQCVRWGGHCSSGIKDDEPAGNILRHLTHSLSHLVSEREWPEPEFGRLWLRSLGKYFHSCGEKQWTQYD